MCDTEPEEQKRGHLALARRAGPVRVEGPQDQPDRHAGLRRLRGRGVEAALRVADLAVFVVSAVDGRRGADRGGCGRRAAELGRPPHGLRQQARPRAGRLRPHARPAPRARFGAGVAPLELPIGEEAGFHGRRRPAHRHRLRLRRPTAGTPPATIPDDMEALEHQVHDNLVEGIVVADDELLERYLEGEVPSVDELEHTLAHGVDRRHRVPGGVRLGHRAGRHRPPGRLHLRDRAVPARPPAGRGRGRRHRSSRSTPDPTGQPLAVRVQDASPTRSSASSRCSRCCRARSAPTTTSSTRASGTDERLHGLFPLRGKEHEPVDRASSPATSAAVAKLTGTAHRRHAGPEGHAGAGRRRSSRRRRCSAIAVKARTQADDDKLANALHRLQCTRTRPSSSTRDDETHQTLLRGMGETHLQVTLERLERKFGVDVDTEEVRVPYRETITRTGRGRGQVQEADRRPRPVRRGATCASSRSSGAPASSSSTRSSAAPSPASSSPRCRRASRRRWPTAACTASRSSTCGSTCFDGKYHPVDSSEMSFKMAGSLGLPGGDGQGRRRSCSSRSRRSRSPSRPSYRATCMGDLNSPARPGAGHRDRRRRRAGGHRARCRRRSSCATPSTCGR